MTRDLPTIPQAKQAAKQLRAALAEQGEAISHAQALERVARAAWLPRLERASRGRCATGRRKAGRSAGG